MPPCPMSRSTSSCGKAALISARLGAARPTGGASSASRSTHDGHRPPGALAGMDAWHWGQILVFMQVPDELDAQRYKESPTAGDCGAAGSRDVKKSGLLIPEF